MSVEYINRRGDRYFVLQGKTKTGKPNYFCARSATAKGVPVEQLPEGYELHERPEDAIVSIRKVRLTRIRSFEREQLAELASELASVPTLVDVDGDRLIVYGCDTNPDEAIRGLSLLIGSHFGNTEKQRDYILQRANYSPMFRFTLADEDERLYSVERWCYLGSIDNWMYLEGGKLLENLSRRYLPHIGRDSYFDLM